jgi:23S rRNA (cytidine1920-2'-O)/16S rRNA (cytidine1409-2'-O)-methyltransferase
MAALARVRLDRLLVDLGHCPSRARARALILAGHVRRDGRILDKPSALVAPDEKMEITGAENPWASRGGLKLSAALEHFAIDPAGARCLDIGASTGGFTDVLLSGGAACVVAVDVGHGQLIERLASDPRITLFERTDARSLTPDMVGGQVDLVVCDVSFISIRKAVGPALTLARSGARFVGLIKPQFEVGPGKVGGGGVVRDGELLERVRAEARDWLDDLPGWRCDGLIDSPVTGGDGTREFLLGGTKIC